MGRKKNKNKNLINVSVDEKAPVGFNALIPEVTILLTESSMNIAKLQKIVDQFRPFYYHKFFILNAENYSKSYILNAVLDFVQPSKLRPIYYNKTASSAYFLANNCLKSIMKIVGNKFKVPHSMDAGQQFKLAIYENCIAPEDVPIIDTHKNINQVLSKLHDPNTRSLNLSNFSNNEDLIEYYPLTNEQIFEQVMKQAALLRPVEVNLSQNSINDLFCIRFLKDSLVVLDISSNNLQGVSSLSALQGLTKLKVLNLTNNPLCQNYDSFNYVKDVKKFCPHLKKLDGKDILIPEFIKNFVCTPDAQYLATQFLEHFFITYDSPNRIDLVHLYQANAIFSVTSKIIPHQSNSKTVKLGHYGIKNPYAVYGIGEIMKLFQEFPKSFHDPYPMVCDVTLYNNTNAHLIVTGIFREYDQVLSFCRSFYFHHSNNEFKIINEQLHVSNALDFQMGWSFTFPVDVEYFGNPLPYFRDEFSQFEKAMQKLTNMNLEYCQKYLVYCNYDLKKALTLFSELYITDDVPKEAFEIQKPKPSNSDTSFCEALKAKVLQKHGSISLKNVWDTLNHDRIENSNDPPISINTSILRIFRKPDVPVNYEDYPIPQESTNVQQNFRDYCDTKLQQCHESIPERKAQTENNTKPISPVLPRRPKPLDVSIPKSRQRNSLVDLANKIARNKELVAKQLEKRKNESTQQMPQSSSSLSFIPPNHDTSSKQLSTIPIRTPQTRPTAAAFFNSPQTPSSETPRPSNYITDFKKQRASQLINIPLVPNKNTIPQPTHTSVVYKLDSADNTQNNVPVAVPVTETLNADTIAKLRENLQKEKQKLQNMKNKLEPPSHKKTVDENKKNKAATSHNTVSSINKQTNTISQPIPTSVIYKLGSADKTQSNVPVAVPVTETLNADTIAKLRENLQKEKQKLINKLEPESLKKTDDENKKNKAATSHSTVSSINKQTNTISQPIHSNVVNQLDSADETQNNVPVAVPVTETLNADTIAKLRENLQKEKQKLKNKLEPASLKKTVDENKKNEAEISQNTVSSINKKTNVDEEIVCEMKSVKDKIAHEENASEKTVILDSQKKSITIKKEGDVLESAGMTNTNNENNPREIDIANKTNLAPKGKIGTDDEKPRPIIESPQKETSVDENEIKRTTVTSKNTEEIKCDQSLSSSGNEITVVKNEVGYEKMLIKEENTKDKQIVSEHCNTSDINLADPMSNVPISNIETKTTTETTSHQESCQKDINPGMDYQIVHNKLIASIQLDNKVKRELDETDTIKLQDLSSSEESTVSISLKPNNDPEGAKRGQKRKLKQPKMKTTTTKGGNSKDESSNKVVTKKSRCARNTRQVNSIKQTPDETKIQYKEFSRNLIVRLHNLSTSELNKGILKSPSLPVVDQKSDDIDASINPVEKNDANSSSPTKRKIQFNLLQKKTTHMNTMESAPSTSQNTESRTPNISDSYNEQLMDTTEEMKPAEIPQNTPKFTLLKSSDMKLKSSSGVDRSEPEKNELQADKTSKDIADSKNDANAMTNVVVNITRMVVNKNKMIESPSAKQKTNQEVEPAKIKPTIRKESPNSSTDNVEIEQIITRDIKEKIEVTDGQCIKVESDEKKIIQEVITMEPVKANLKTVEKESPTSNKDNLNVEKSKSEDIKRETESADVECNKVKSSEEKTVSNQDISKENIEKSDVKSKITLETIFKLDENDDDDDVPLSFLNMGSDNDD